MWTYRATCLRWIDGDTIEIRIDCGFRLYTIQRIRLAGLDTPETRAPDPAVRARAAAATARAEALLPPGATCTVVTAANPLDRYGRWLGTLTTASGVDVNAALLAEGHARPYDGGVRTP